MPKKLSEEEIEGVDSYIDTELEEDKDFVQRVRESKSYKDTTKRTEQQLRDLERWQRKVERGEKQMKNRNGEIVAATMDRVNDITKLDRPWYTDTEMLDDVLMRKRCPLDGTLYKPEEVAVDSI